MLGSCREMNRTHIHKTSHFKTSPVADHTFNVTPGDIVKPRHRDRKAGLVPRLTWKWQVTDGDGEQGEDVLMFSNFILSFRCPLHPSTPRRGHGSRVCRSQCVMASRQGSRRMSPWSTSSLCSLGHDPGPRADREPREHCEQMIGQDDAVGPEATILL
jgi:hypothetical protein